MSSDQVAQRMTDDDDRVVATAAVAVLRGEPSAPRAATAMLHSEDAEARQIAVNGIGRKIGKLALADLEAAGPTPTRASGAPRSAGWASSRTATCSNRGPGTARYQ